jgi:hypothetical protein
VKISLHLRFTVSVPMTDLPLVGFHLLMVLTFTRVQSLRSTTITLQSLLVCCQIRSYLRSMA